MMASMQFTGTVLAGGKSSRFGQNKALYVYQNKPLIHWVLNSLDHASERFVIANQPLDLQIPVYPDLKSGFGSLSGVHAALSYAKYDWVAIAACDLPFLSCDYWRQLQGHINNVQIVMAQNQEGFSEPLAALYHRSILPLVEAQIESQNLTLHHLATITRTKLIPWNELKPKVDRRLFLNANTVHDLPIQSKVE
jgi:molybdopterin-guanine dinucleotide biosynthesis protein A